MKIKILIALLLGGFALGATAGSVTGKVDYVVTRASDGLTYFNIIGATSGAPDCAKVGYWMIKDENSEVGKRQYSMILAAAHLEKL